MPRRPRGSQGGYVYHVMNRGVGKMTLFETDSDYMAFLAILRDVQEKRPLDLFAYCLMPNHWHFVMRPKADKDMSRFMQQLTTTHARRWRKYRDSVGVGYVYQGRFKSFPIKSDAHYLKVCRYVERNAMRANLVRKAERWQWGSLWQRQNTNANGDRPALSKWPVRRPGDWIARVNRPQTREELDVIRQCIRRGQPFGDPPWVQKLIRALDLEHTLRNPGRPKRGTGLINIP